MTDETDGENLPAPEEKPASKEKSPENEAAEAFIRSLPEHMRKTLETLPPDQSVKLLSEFSASISYSGPYPPPELVKGYEEVLPGTADRIFRMAEKQQEIQESTNRGLLHNDRIRICGQIAIALGTLGVAGIAASRGNAIIAVPVALAGFVHAWITLIRNFFAGKRETGRDDQGG